MNERSTLHGKIEQLPDGALTTCQKICLRGFIRGYNAHFHLLLCDDYLPRMKTHIHYLFSVLPLLRVSQPNFS